jgi:opacity protein-like surface antigen
MDPKITTIATAVLIAGAPVRLEAQDNAESFYVHADAGAVYMQDLTFHFRLGPKSGSFSDQINPGARGDIAAGYNLTDPLAVELETGALWNRSRSDIDIFQIPLLESLVYRAHLKNGWTPYFGAGAGADFAVLNASVFTGKALVRESDDDVTFGYQAQAGISYAISPNADLDIGYKFFGSFEHHWDFGDLGLDSDKIYTHAVLLSFRWNF